MFLLFYDFAPLITEYPGSSNLFPQNFCARLPLCFTRFCVHRPTYSRNYTQICVLAITRLRFSRPRDSSSSSSPSMLLRDFICLCFAPRHLRATNLPISHLYVSASLRHCTFALCAFVSSRYRGYPLKRLLADQPVRTFICAYLTFLCYHAPFLCVNVHSRLSAYSPSCMLFYTAPNIGANAPTRLYGDCFSP